PGEHEAGEGGGRRQASPKLHADESRGEGEGQCRAGAWIRQALCNPAYEPLEERMTRRFASPEALVERAKASTGLDDFGPDDWKEGLETLAGELQKKDFHD